MEPRRDIADREARPGRGAARRPGPGFFATGDVSLLAAPIRLADNRWSGSGQLAEVRNQSDDLVARYTYNGRGIGSGVGASAGGCVVCVYYFSAGDCVVEV